MTSINPMSIKILKSQIAVINKLELTVLLINIIMDLMIKL